VLVQITIGFAVLLGVGLVVLPRVVDLALRRWGGDAVARYLVVIVALLLMAMLAQVFGIEGIVGAFFAGLALNRLVPNEGPSMEKVEFFGAAVFVPIFLVSIGLLLDPSVMFTGETLKLAAYICAAALLGKLIACWVAGAWLDFSRAERGAMFVLTAPQAAATLAVTLIGFEIGVFGTTVVNAVLVLILVSIVFSALLTQKVIAAMPTRATSGPRLGAHVLVIAGAAAPSDGAVRAAALLARPDSGHGELLVARTAEEEPLEAADERALEQRLARLGFEGRIRSELEELGDAVGKALRGGKHSLVIVDEPRFAPPAGRVPVLVVDAERARATLFAADGRAAIAQEIRRRLARDTRGGLFPWRAADRPGLELADGSFDG
jgi:hypothetical protein